MSWPVYYRNKSQCLYIFCTFAFGIAWSGVDVYLELTMAPMSVAIGCAASGCFTSKNYHIYQGVSNSVRIT